MAGALAFYLSYSSNPLRVSPSTEFNYLACASNNDCTTTYYPLNNCCMDCDIFPINLEGLKLQEKWRKDNCDNHEISCPTYKCLWPNKGVLCIQNKCQLEE